jgi:transcriptional/translational regulatory protein YebC/TACO1
MGRKWQNIKLDKGKSDQQRGALFTKLSKEIVLAVKGGSPDPESNHRLKIAVEKARENNMPQENIKRAIARGAGGTGEKEIEELRYEGYGPHGVAVVIDAAAKSEDALTELALVEGVVDVDYAEEEATIYTELALLAHAREALETAGLRVRAAYLGMRAKQTVALEADALREVLAFLEILESHEDAQHVFSNLELSDAALEALA